jgi:hypothetical protein
MSKFLNIDGDYKISVTDGGEIRLDPGTDGKVKIIGNLEVDGDQTIINSSTLVVDDPFVTVNQGGVSGGVVNNSEGDVAGIQIDRGGSDAFWVYDEQGLADPVFIGRTGSPSTGTIVDLRTSRIQTGGADLKLINDGTGIVTVEGCTDYEKQIFEYDGSLVDFTVNPVLKANQHDTLVNAKGVVDYVDGFFVGKFQNKIESLDTFVVVHDSDAFAIDESAIEFTIDNTPAAKFFNNRAELQHLRIQDTTIETTSSNADLVLSAPGTGNVQINDVLYIPQGPYQDDDGTGGGGIPNFGVDADTANPDAPGDGIKLYSKAEGAAGSSLYFINGGSVQDELVSKKKALLFSMIL